MRDKVFFTVFRPGKKIKKIEAKEPVLLLQNDFFVGFT